MSIDLIIKYINMSDDYNQHFSKERHEKWMKEIQGLRNQITEDILGDYFWNWEIKGEDDEKQLREKLARNLYDVRDRMNKVLDWLGID